MPDKHRLPIYLNINIVSGMLPAEQTYSTYPEFRYLLVGYVVSEYPLQRKFDGKWGAMYDHPDVSIKDFYSTELLVRYANENTIYLNWEKA